MALENHESQYLNMLENAFSFLHRKVRAANGSPINQTVHDFVISYGAQCPHCGINLSRSNSNTEHIHDLALGGENKSYNKIIMCRDCNLARNKTMQVYLGAPSYWRGFPGNWDRVKNYLLWNAITVDKGHRAGENYPEVHSIFESILTENRVRILPPSWWSGRGGQGKVSVQNSKRVGFWTRFFDKVFGYTPNITSSEKKVHTELVKKTRKNNVRERIDVSPEFRSHILSALNSVEGEIKLATFSNYFQLYLVGNGYKKQSLKEFARSFGIPKKRSCVDIIEDYFPEDIAYRREGDTIVYIFMKNREVFESLANEEE